MINTKFFIILIFIWMLFLVLILDSAANSKNERYYQDKWCNNHNGETEYILSDKTRVDCLTETHAIEFDFAGKWEAIGQSLHYGLMTSKTPGIVYM